MPQICGLLLLLPIDYSYTKNACVAVENTSSCILIKWFYSLSSLDKGANDSAGIHAGIHLDVRWGGIFLKIKNNIAIKGKFHPDFQSKCILNFNSKQKLCKDIYKIIQCARENTRQCNATPFIFTEV